MLWTGCLQQEPCSSIKYGISPHLTKAPTRGFFHARLERVFHYPKP
nr:MAG TPA: hypothetical protein [Bacteriophage sp.]